MKRIALALWLSALALPALAQQASYGPVPGNDFVLPGAYPTGRFFGPAATSAPSATAVGAANRLMVAPMYMRGGSTVKTLSFNITTGNVSAWNGRPCIYADTGAGLPGALVADGGTVAVGSGSITGVQTATLGGGGTTLPAGWYWVGMMMDSASESVSSIGNAVIGPMSSSRLLGWAAVANITGTTTATGVYMAQTFGACPATFSASPTYGDGAALPYVVLGF